MEYFVMAENPAPKTINNKKLKINFASKNNWTTQGIIEHKTDSGYINVSSPELTALDLFAHTNKFGINRIVSVLQELVDEMKPSELAKIAKMYENTAAIQRLGYVLEFEILHEKLAESLWKAIEKQKIFPVYLSVQKEKNGKSENRWKVIKNIEIESDL
jgi:predicted transcriptional regulator of viral defense system